MAKRGLVIGGGVILAMGVIGLLMWILDAVKVMRWLHSSDPNDKSETMSTMVISVSSALILVGIVMICIMNNWD